MAKDDLARTDESFAYEVYRATASLMYLLQGMESVRAVELALYNRLVPLERARLASHPELSYVDVPLTLSGAAFDANDVLRREGEAEQLAFTGWIERVYNCIWDGGYRNELKWPEANAIRPEVDAMGDLRRIRNDLVHNSAVATEEWTGKCKILRWFAPGERMTLGMRHVFDFLNHMALMTRSGGRLANGSFSSWAVFPDMHESLERSRAVSLVSLRASFVREAEDGCTWHAVTVVFENGVFGNLAVEVPASRGTVRERIDWIEGTRIDEDGNVRYRDGTVEDRRRLYRSAVDGLLGRGRKVEGMFIPGPSMRMAKDPRQNQD